MTKYTFGPFTLEPAEERLLCNGQPVALTPKAFDTLVALVTRAGRLVEKDELMKVVWPDAFVEEANLTVNISTIRKALGDGRDGQRYIETVPKRGYRFVAPVRTEMATASEAAAPREAAVEPDRGEPARAEPDRAEADRGGRFSRWLLIGSAAIVIGAIVTLAVAWRMTPIRPWPAPVLGDPLARLTDDLGVDTQPSWSPDATRIAFASNRHGKHDIYVLVVGSPAPPMRLTTHPAVDESPAWSPDGKRIAFAQSVNEHYDILVMDADGSHQLNITASPTSSDYYPMWSPDGAQLVFQSDRDGNAEIYTIDVASPAFGR